MIAHELLAVVLALSWRTSDFIVSATGGHSEGNHGSTLVVAWLDLECHRRFDKRFIVCTDAERRQVLDDISWPRRTVEGMNPGISFFNSFRDLTASGFWTSEMGINDIQYMGNTFVPKWTGCPPEVLTKLGLE